MPPGSDSKLESLRKILEQEETSSFPDTTVIGGLDRFLTRWADELKPAVEGLNSYSVLTPPQRAEWAGRAREKMASTGPAADTRTPATRSRQVRRAAKPRPTALALDDDVTRLKGISTWGVSLTTVALMLLPSVGGVSASSKSASSNIMSIYLSSGVLSGGSW